MVQAHRKHKPSPKHTLDDVLSSLQDLVRNELSNQAPAATPGMSHHRSVMAQTNRGGDKVSAGDVLNSLKSLIDGDHPAAGAEDDDIVIEALPIDDTEQANIDEIPATPPAEAVQTDTPEINVDIETIEIEAPPAGDDSPEDIEDVSEDRSDAITEAGTGVEEIVATEAEPVTTSLDMDEPDATILADNNDDQEALASGPEAETSSTDDDTSGTDRGHGLSLAPEDETVPEAIPDQPLFGGEQLEVDFDIELGNDAASAETAEAAPSSDDTASGLDFVPATPDQDTPSPPAGDGPDDDEIEDTITLTADKPVSDDQEENKTPLATVDEAEAEAEAETETEADKTASTSPEQIGAPAETVEKPAPSPKKAGRTASLEQVEINWDDIPVLDDVALNPLSADEEAPAATPTKSTPETQKPPPIPSRPEPAAAPSQKTSPTRDIALKAIAKLNIQLRKSGERSLEPLMVDRLQYVLKEILEQGGSNMDNTPSKSKK